MCTIVKVKRKITDDPVDCLIIECKKKKLLDADISTNGNGAAPRKDQNGSIKHILKYVGSASNEEEIPAKIKELNSSAPSNGANKTVDNSSNKASARNDETKKRVNFVVLSKKRGLSNENDESKGSAKKSSKNETGDSSLDQVNIIDVISSAYFDQDTQPAAAVAKTASPRAAAAIACNGVEMIREKIDPSADYVYDIYFARSNPSHLDLLYPTTNIEIKSYNDSELIDETNSSDEKEDIYDEDEDSNDEQNWRNDYPDEEDDDIDDEDDEEPSTRRYNPRQAARSNPNYDEDDDDDYQEYGYGYDDDDPHGKKLASYMKKSLGLDRSYNEEESSENEDYDEYKHDPLDRSYTSYKKRILKEFKADYKEDF